MTAALLTFTSHISGKNAKVEIWNDRIEWELPRGVSGGKIMAGLATGGMSLFATGVQNGRAGTEMIPIRSISSVTTARDGFRNTVVSVITTGNTIDFRVSHAEAANVKALLQQLMLGGPVAATTPVSTPAAPAAAPAPAPAPVDLGAQLQQLEGLRQGGILTQDEFDTKKAEILARM
ncbi:putative oligomerization/nucleic acid binding protein [Frigoribacterium sp. PhB160]|uniref:SHOCT domain-containing protein n=1 Tax=Frigoribacterium sp. PhB160 TaxID=2485192 RepID=UPI000FB89677|nr:SHOCT domain-containing protein [Frigoribacterium sp. PhB160]ROS62219.1 putative oligomerization/nucleic acid binding protein [Frigoribacterium sp. PhB160]